MPNFVKITAEMAEKAIKDTDWEKIDAMTDEDINAQIAADPDVAPITLLVNVAAVRKSLKLSQSSFAEKFCIPIGTLQDWEQGRTTPDMAARSFLRVIAKQPDLVAEALM